MTYLASSAMRKAKPVRAFGNTAREPKRETITLAIDKKVLEEIRLRAARDGMSINGFINGILNKWTNYYKYLAESQAVLLTAKNFHAHLENIDEEVIVNEFKENAINLIPSTLADRNIPLTLENIIEYEYKMFGVDGGAFLNVKSEIDAEGHRLVLLRHNHGIKWSRIVAKGITAEMETLFRYQVAVDELTPNLVRIKILDKA